MLIIQRSSEELDKAPYAGMSHVDRWVERLAICQRCGRSWVTGVYITAAARAAFDKQSLAHLELQAAVTEGMDTREPCMTQLEDWLRWGATQKDTNEEHAEKQKEKVSD